MAFQKATRKQQKLRLALVGPSGSGKTRTALEICKGLGGPQIGVIDTERGSSELYCDVADFMVCQLAPPYSPDRYIQMMNEAAGEGIDPLIIDSGSHAWVGQGGVLEMADQYGKGKNNPFGGWREATPQHQKLVEAMLTYPGHLILTMRTKTAYEIQENERGKKAPVKIGLAPVQRDGLEYEFTVVMDLSIENYITVSKDRTSLFKEKPPFIGTPETGKLLKEWLETGADPQAVFSELFEDSKGHLNDLKSWYRDNQWRIKSLPQGLQDKLISDIKQLSAQAA